MAVDTNRHRNLGAGSIHPLPDYEYASVTAMNDATGFAATDIGKVAKITTTPPDFYILTATTPSWECIACDGVYLDDYTSSGNAGSIENVNEVVIDASSQDATSETHAFDVSLASTLVGNVSAVGTGEGVDPIHQHIGTFTSPGANYACRVTSSGTVYTDNIDAQTIFVAANDAIAVGHSAVFDSLQLVFTTAATKDCVFTFYYYDSPSWIQFYPTDGTSGGRQDGTISWNSGDLAGWDSADPAGAVGDTGYWMKVVRTRVASPGTVVLATAKYKISTTYEWDKDGKITVANINVADDIVHTGDANNLISFGTDTQSFETGGTSRLDISDSGVRMGAAGARVTSITDSDTLGTSDTILCTQGNVKAYSDARNVIAFCLDGSAYVDTTITGFLCQFSGQLLEAHAYATTAPTGADIIIDVNKNGTSMLSTTLQIDATANADDNNVAIKTDTTEDVVAGDRITIDIDQVGSTVAGGVPLYITLIFGK